MRKRHLWLGSLLAIFLSALFVFSVFSNSDRADGIALLSPSACPSGGCAAGQRLNYSLSYAVSPQFNGTNTQVCVYAPFNGWADFGRGWISAAGLVTGATYAPGQINTVCASNTPPGYEWLGGAYANLPNASTSDQLEVALNISTSTITSGSILFRVFEVDAGGTNWSQTTEFTSSTLAVAPLAQTVFVANNAATCAANTPCFINSGDDLADGLGTGLRDALNAVSDGATLQLLGDYLIKDETVLIDKDVTLTGVNDASLTYYGSDCSNSMLSITAAATIQNLTLDDGSCTSSSRTLIDVDSADAVTIHNNTLMDGYIGVLVRNNTGQVDIAFNTFETQDSYAVLQENNGSDLLLYANNIVDNANGLQVICYADGAADHNFWGTGQTAPANVLGCQVSNGKELGAAALTVAGTPGVSAEKVTVTTSKQYAFNNKIAYSRSDGANYDLIIVNHGQGSSENVPFYNELGNSVSPCSNHYDVFLADGESPSSLNLALKYDLNADCTAQIESSTYCASGSMAAYPLWWYDPAANVTEYWDTTGQAPAGSGANGAAGQITSCNTSLNEIQVTLNNLAANRPRLSTDLGFTPFVVGLPNEGGIDLSQFTVTFDVTQNKIRWSTTAESNISGFHVLRSDTENGTYARISPLIASIGDTNIGGIYYFNDESILYTRTYYYKLEVVNQQGESIEFYGPVSVITSTATPTSTLTRTPTVTRTPYPTRTATPYYYRSPTSYYRRATATPIGSGPTQVRTYGPTPTPSRTSATKPTYNPTTANDASGYPADGYPVIGTESPSGGDGYPAENGTGDQISTPAPNPDGGQDAGTPGQEQGENTPGGSSNTSGGDIQWPFMALGAGFGVVALAFLSWVLIKTRVH